MNPRPPAPRTDPSTDSGAPGSARRAVAVAIAAAVLVGGLWLSAGRGAAQEEARDPLSEIQIGLPAFVYGDDIERPRVQYRDSTISLNNVCAVRHSRLDPNRDPVYVNGQPIGFCCTPCPAVFSLNPERYLIELKLEFDDPVTPKTRATIDSSRRLTIGQDIYFFSNLETMNRFRKDPLAYCGKLTDPVSHARFRPSPASPHVRYRARDYWFAADSTKARFQQTPERFSDRQTGS